MSGGKKTTSSASVLMSGSGPDPTFKKYEFLRDFEGHQKIGSGGFGIVVQAKKTAEKTVTALKLIPFDNRKTIQQTLEEAEKLSKIKPHPAVIRCLDFWTDSFTKAEYQQFLKLIKPNKDDIFCDFPLNSNAAGFLCIQMELCGNGNLRNWLKKRTTLSVAEVDFTECIKIFFQVAKGIEHIHNHGLIHRDLKPGNILFKGTQVKVSDLGYSATHYSGDYAHTKNAGACLYQAPEQAYGRYGKAVDYYALGLILYELFYPAGQKNVGEMITEIKYSRNIPTDLESKFPEIAMLIKSLLSVDANHRPNAEEIQKQMEKWAAFSTLSHDAFQRTLNDFALDCQRCGKVLTDVRFKCSICPDFFLCQECEAIEGVHPTDHDMIKIKTPVPLNGSTNGRGSGKEKETNTVAADAATKSGPGCEHYRRRCRLLCPDAGCKRFFSCRLCHDQAIKGHKLDRRNVKMIECVECLKVQPKGKVCRGCGIRFAKYYCPACSLYDDDENAEELIFHCDDCGFCRKKAHKLLHYTHCHYCCMCYPNMVEDYDGETLQLPQSHNCFGGKSLGAGKLLCSVCQKEMHESRESAVLVACHHYVHSSCRTKFPDNQTKCPVCGNW